MLPNTEIYMILPETKVAIVKDRGEDWPLRCSVIATLGKLAHTEDKVVSALRRIIWNAKEDGDIRAAALAALRQLDVLSESDISSLRSCRMNSGSLARQIAYALGSSGVADDEILREIKVCIFFSNYVEAEEAFELLTRLCQKREDEAPLPW